GRVVAVAGTDLFDLDERRARLGADGRSAGLGHDLEPCADAGAVAFGSHDANLDPTAVQGRFAVEQLRRSVDAVHDRVQAAVVVVVAHSEAPGLGRRGDAGASDQAHIFKLTVAQVAVEVFAFGVGGVHLGAIHLGIDVAVGDQDVEPAVVVDVEEADAPAQQAGVDAQAG